MVKEELPDIDVKELKMIIETMRKENREFTKIDEYTSEGWVLAELNLLNIKSQEKLSRLTLVLTIFTIFLVILTMILVYYTIILASSSV